MFCVLIGCDEILYVAIYKLRSTVDHSAIYRFALPFLCSCGGYGQNRGPWGQPGQSSQTRREQVAIPVTRPFSNISASSKHGVNTFTAPLGNLSPMAGLCKSLW